MHDANRVLAFRRWEGAQDILVMASLNNHDFGAGYRIQHPAIADGRWQEIFNSDAGDYGGSGLINAGTIEAAHGSFTALLASQQRGSLRAQLIYGNRSMESCQENA